MKEHSNYANSADKMDRAQRKKDFNRKYRIILSAAMLLVFIGSLLAYHNRDFESFRKVRTIEENDLMQENIQLFKDGMVKYSENNITYYDGKGNKIWSKGYSVSKLKVKINADYVMVVDMKGYQIFVFDEKGKKRKISTTYEISDAEISDQGVVAVSLATKNTNYIELYNLKAERLVSIKSSIDEHGYPMDITLSPDGQRLCASYFAVDGVEIKNRLTFYDFGTDSEKNGHILGGVDCNNTVVPTVAFMGNDSVCAFGDNKISIYNVGHRIKLKKEVEILSTIKSIDYDADHFTVIRGRYGEEDAGDYTLDIFSKNGNRIGSAPVRDGYSSMKIYGDKVILTSPYSCSVVILNGKEQFKYNFTKHLIRLIPGINESEYFILYEDRLDLIKLH